MARLLLDKDIKPLSEFRANAAGFIKQVQQTKRPLVITSHGKSAAVLMGVSEYESLIDEIELLQDIKTAEQQIDRGKGLSHQQAKQRVLAKLRR
ncbi:MAG TPA: prevent-host-death family protein [Nitrospiraceae bacterium]|jgi:prevent-host-death family protein|nr:prevent-host-death family protein [Nitrospiraceae bacterium]